MSQTMNVKIQQIIKTTAQWAEIVAVIPNKVLCFEDAGTGGIKVKIGDGTSTWSQLPYLNGSDIDFSTIYTKTETDNAISTAISGLGTVIRVKGKKATVSELPTTGNQVGDVWFVGTTGESANTFEEFVWTADEEWESIGKPEIDMSVYYTKTEVNTLLDDKVDKVSGKGLSSNDFTASYKAMLDTVDSTPTSASTNFVTSGGVYTALGDKVDKVQGKGLSTEDFTSSYKAMLDTVDSTPTSSSTNFVESGGVYTALADKVDKVNGKGLSANDFTDAYKTMLDTVDTAPTASSTNFVQSGGVKTALDGKVNYTDELILDCQLSVS